MVDAPAPVLPRRFDSQARRFGDRAGLPPEARSRIAAAVVALADSRGSLLDIGAGTGEIGLELCQATPAYIGVDESPGMLAEFRARAEAAALDVTLHVADANLTWPVQDGACGLVFGSRSLHWLAPDHIVEEWLRVRRGEGAPLVIGRVARDPESPRERLRREMRRLLLAAGFEGRSGRGQSHALRDAVSSLGGSIAPPRVVAEWTVTRPARAAVDDWAAKDHLAGVAVPDPLKAEILRATACFAAEAFGNTDEPLPYVERYTLEIARVPSRQAPVGAQ